jgi:hypothetical protein
MGGETASAVSEVANEACGKQRPMQFIRAELVVVIVNLFLHYVSFRVLYLGRD